jgi:hypothetical protein
MSIYRLPIEILLETRDFLVNICRPLCFVLDNYSASFRDYSHYESECSWRNFLSTDRQQMKPIRKKAMIWSLNLIASGKYWMDDIFRECINTRMENIRIQLQLRVNYTFARSSNSCDTNSNMMIAIKLDRISHLRIYSLCVEEFPSLCSVQSLVLDECNRLVSIGDYPNLKYLKVYNCEDLKFIGRVPQLSCFIGDGSSPSLLNYLPVKSLQELSFSVDGRLFQDLQLLFLFQHLRKLKINNMHFIARDSVPFLPFPELQSLIVRGFEVINISGLYTLKELSIGNAITVIGKEEIYPRLKSLHGYKDCFREGEINLFPHLRSLQKNGGFYIFTTGSNGQDQN